MRVTKNQIIQGVTDYLKSDILPKMGEERALQIIVTVVANAVAANQKLADALFQNDMIRALLEDDGTGTYEIGGIADAMRDAINQFGAFPLTVPVIPVLAPREITLKLSGADVESMRRRIEGDAE